MCGKLLGYKWICLLVQLPRSSPTCAGPRLVGHTQPPWASDPTSWRYSGFSAWQHVQILQYTENSKEQDICEQLPGRQRWVETFAFFLWAYCSCWLVSVHSWQNSRGKQRRRGGLCLHLQGIGNPEIIHCSCKLHHGQLQQEEFSYLPKRSPQSV